MTENNPLYVGVIDMTKCPKEERENWGWLALAMFLGDTQCPICGKRWNCRQDVIDRGTICGYNGDVVCKDHWEQYIRFIERKKIK